MKVKININFLNLAAHAFQLVNREESNKLLPVGIHHIKEDISHYMS
jgi:hypothetical protein